MRYFNEDKTIELQEKDIDYDRGTVIEDTLIIHHEEEPEIIEVPEEGHYETLREYPNGGKDVKWVVDVPAVKGQAKKEAYDEEEIIYVYKPYSNLFLREKELSQEISALKQRLSETDYKAIKYFEGYYTAEQYAPIKAEREGWREQIRELEEEIDALPPLPEMPNFE